MPCNNLYISNLDQILQCRHDQSILEVLLANKIDIPHSCGGNGTCGTCLISISAAIENCSIRAEIEQEIANDRKLSSTERLACQTFITGDVAITAKNISKK